MNGADGLMIPQGTMSGDTWYDQIIGSINNAVNGYFDSRTPATSVPLPAAPAAAQTDLVMLLAIGLVLYLVLK